MMRREKLKHYMLQQRFIQSPYAAHLNFKTFENFFDVEICGEEEKGGRTTYKLKRINPQKRYQNQHQQMMLWMMQNNPTGEFIMNKDGRIIEQPSPMEQEMILAEGFQQKLTNSGGK